MIDPRRWILVETWLALGLRVEWISRWEADSVPPGEWMQDDEDGRRYVYAGNRVWKVLDDRRGVSTGGPYTAPTFGVETLKHELAHYLAATEEQRGRRNFGIDPGPTGASEENAALATEQVIDAVVAAAARIATLALNGGARG